MPYLRFHSTLLFPCRGLVAALLLAASLPASGQTPPLGGDDLIEPVRAGSGATNNHPVALDPGRLFEALASLEIEIEPTGLFRRNPELRRMPIFTEDQLGQLVPHLVEAFARLERDQDLGVSISQSRRGNEIGFLSGSRTTSARIFHADGEVHLIFGQVEKDVTLERDRPGRAVPNAPQSLGLDRGVGLLDSIGTRKRSTQLEWKLRLPEGARLVDPARNDWLAVRPAAFDPPANAAHKATTNRSVRPEKSAAAAQDINPSSPDETPPAESKTPQALPESRSPANPVEQKLRMLKRYRDQGLIDEELYREKVRELIDAALETQR